MVYAIRLVHAIEMVNATRLINRLSQLNAMGSITRLSQLNGTQSVNHLSQMNATQSVRPPMAADVHDFQGNFKLGGKPVFVNPYIKNGFNRQEKGRIQDGRRPRRQT